MTTIREETKTCVLCGKSAKYVEIASTSSFGAFDLDTRPSEPMRSTVDMLMQTCPFCGYCYRDISASIDDATLTMFIELVSSSEYRQQLSDPHYPKLANTFLCSALLKEEAADYSGAGWDALHAAWICDDKASSYEMNRYSLMDKSEKQDSITAAKRCRTRAAHLLKCARQSGQHYGKEPGIEEAVLADVLRRSGQFDEAMQICEEALGKELEKTTKDVIRLDMLLASNKDSQAYTLSSIDSFITIPDLVIALEHDNTAELIDAITALGGYKGRARQAVPGLIKALHNPDGAVRRKAAWAIGEIGNKDNFGPLYVAMADSNLMDRFKASIPAEEAGQWSLSSLEQYLKDEGLWDVLPRRKALETIGNEAMRALVLALDDDEVWSSAVTALGQIGQVEVIPEMIKSGKNMDYGQQQDLEKALRKMGDPQKKYQFFTFGIPDALCNIGNNSLLVRLLSDSDDYLRYVAIRAISALRNMEFLPVLIETIRNDEVEGIRLKAAEGLSYLGKEANEAVLSVSSLLKHERSWIVRATLIEALGRFRRKEAVPVLARALRDKNRCVQREALEVLGKIGGSEAIACLNKTLNDRDYHKRMQAMEILSEKGSISSIPALKKALKDKIPWMREHAAKALARIERKARRKVQ